MNEGEVFSEGDMNPDKVEYIIIICITIKQQQKY